MASESLKARSPLFFRILVFMSCSNFMLSHELSMHCSFTTSGPGQINPRHGYDLLKKTNSPFGAVLFRTIVSFNATAIGTIERATL